MLEVLSAGAIPVLIADNYVKPFDTLIQWPRCLLQFPTNEIHRILPTLRALSRKEIELRQQYCQHIFRSALQDDSTLMRSVMLSFRERFMGILPNLPLMDGDLYPFIT
jgi:glucuronyl/N-acetylglucosaminyl transferase EXT1